MPSTVQEATDKVEEVQFAATCRREVKTHTRPKNQVAVASAINDNSVMQPKLNILIQRNFVEPPVGFEPTTC